MSRERHQQPQRQPESTGTDAPPEHDRDYRPPTLVDHGPLGALVRGASWKGVDSVGQLNPDESYPG